MLFNQLRLDRVIAVLPFLLVPQNTGVILFLSVSLEEMVLLTSVRHSALLHSKGEAIVFQLHGATLVSEKRRKLR